MSQRLVRVSDSELCRKPQEALYGGWWQGCSGVMHVQVGHHAWPCESVLKDCHPGTCMQLRNLMQCNMFPLPPPPPLKLM